MILKVAALKSSPWRLLGWLLKAKPHFFPYVGIKIFAKQLHFRLSKNLVTCVLHLRLNIARGELRKNIVVRIKVIWRYNWWSIQYGTTMKLIKIFVLKIVFTFLPLFRAAQKWLDRFYTLGPFLICWKFHLA